ncbi:MAG: zinc ribbon domain-containing protein [Candidatus Thorarchaeota archaeon]
MRVCANCGKSNLPTRKYCIRCGRSLLTPEVKPAKAKEPRPEVPEVGRTVTAASLKRAEAKVEPPAPVDVDEEWVKPSEVSKDRVRTSTTKRQTELEKAQAAFKRAEEVGIDDDDATGVVETRMLRASEVKELMEGVSEMHTSHTEYDLEEDEYAAGPPPIAAPSPKDIESHLLGSMSAYVDKPEPPVQEEPFSEDFTSSKYDDASAEDSLDYDLSDIDGLVVERTTPPSITSDESVTTCPSCGEVINVDSFEYPHEVYSAMGAARVKQARFYVVQGKYDEAQKIVRIARALYLKADDQSGIAEVSKLVDSLARRG